MSMYGWKAGRMAEAEAGKLAFTGAEPGQRPGSGAGRARRRRGSGFRLAAVGMAAALGGVGWAQSPNPAAEETTRIVSPAAQGVLDALAALKELPAAEWKTYGGAAAHGELVDLDDAGWESTKPPSRAPVDAVWYRRWVEIPAALHGYDLTGSRIWFQFHAKVNGPMPEIVYFDGRRVAMGDDLEPMVLTENAQPHERVLVAVKLLGTVDEKTFNGATLRVEFAAKRPSPSDLLTEFLAAQQLIPRLSKDPAADTATLDRAIERVDTACLEREDQACFDESLRKAQAGLEALRPMLRQATFSLTGNAHIDAAWLWPVSETYDVVKRTFATALQLMDEYPAYTFTQSSAAYSEWIAEKYPVLNEEIKKRIREGRWEIVGGMWVEPDLNMPDGESLARSLLLGTRWFEKNYGVEVRIGWNPDSFGYNWQLPQIYKKSGIDYFVTQKETWNDTNHFPFNLFWWESPDGSRVLTYFPSDYVHLDLNPVRLAHDYTALTRNAPGLTETMDLYGVGDHGGGPTRAIFDEGLHWMQPDKVVPRMKFATAQQFFDDVQARLSADSPVWDYRKIAGGYTAPGAASDGRLTIPTWKSEIYFEYHRGVMTSQAEHKRGMRRSEVETLSAERYAALAWLRGQTWPGAELTADWKKVTFNQFHDLAAGSGVGNIYKDAQDEFHQVHLSTEAITAKALDWLARDIDTRAAAENGNSAAVVVFNPLAWKRAETVEVQVELPRAAAAVEAVGPRGALPVQVAQHAEGSNQFRLLLPVEAPSLGYSVIHVTGVQAARPAATELKASGTTLENAKLRVVIDPASGCITSLYDKRTQFETLARGGCGNELQAFHDQPTLYDAWNIDYGTLDHATALDKADAVELIEKGPLRAAIRITRTWRESKLVQVVSLDAGADAVKVSNDIDWHERHTLLKAAVPLAAGSAFATYEIPYGTIERPTTRNNSWEKAQFEVPALRWADLGNGRHGLSLINESKYGYDALGNVLRLTLLRSPTWPDPQADQGHHRFGYELYPHAGDWKEALTIRHGYDYNYPLHVEQVLEHAGRQPAERSFVAVDAPNVVVTAVKKAEDAAGLVLHFYEWAGKPTEVTIHAPEGAASAVVTNLMEKPEGTSLPVKNGSVTVPVGAYEIKTILLNYPQNGPQKGDGAR